MQSNKVNRSHLEKQLAKIIRQNGGKGSTW